MQLEPYVFDCHAELMQNLQNSTVSYSLTL